MPEIVAEDIAVADSTAASQGADTGVQDQPETPASPTPDTASAPPQAGAGPDRGDGRDARGLFAKKGEGADPTAVDATTKGASSPTDPQAAAPLGSNPADAPLAAPVESPPATWSPKLFGQEYPIPGSRVTADEIAFPITLRDDVERLVGQGLRWQQERESIKREKAELHQKTVTLESDSKAMSAEIDQLLQIVQIEDPEQMAEALVRYGFDLRRALPTLQERREIARERAAIELEKAARAPDPAESREREIAQVHETAASWVQEWSQHPSLKHLTDADRQRILAKVQARPQAFAYRVGQNPTPQEIQAGAKPGEIVFDTDALLLEVQTVAEYRAEEVKARTAAEQRVREAQKAAAENAQRLASPAVPPPMGAPPAAQPTTPPAESPRPGRRFQSLEEYERYIEGR